MFDTLERLLRQHSETYLHGAAVTLQLAALAILGALAIGILAGATWRGRFKPLTWAITAYVEVFRNTPLILQVVYAYFALPELGLKLSGYQAGTIALTLNGGAYLTVVISSGIRAVGPGQRQAAQVLGLDGRATFTSIVLPQAIRYVYPPIVNQFVLMIHGTSIMSLIAVEELTGAASEVNSQTFLTMESYGIAAVLYLIIINGVVWIAGRVGRLIFRAPIDGPRRRSGSGSRRFFRSLRAQRAVN